MELLLNALWLLLSVGTLLVWVRQGRLAPKHPRIRHGLLVLSCVVALLFPVISMTDDLHAQQFAFEDATATSKKLLKAADRSKTSVQVYNSPAIVLLASSRCPSRLAIGFVHGEPQATVVSVPSPRTPERAPPSFS